MELYQDDVENDVLILAADGGLNAETAEQFVHEIETLVEAGLTKVIVDCSKLTYITSVGLGVLIRLHNKMTKHGGDVKICSVQGLVPQVLQVTRLDMAFEIYPDLGRARLAFRPHYGEPG